MRPYFATAICVGLAAYLAFQAIVALRSGRLTALVPIGPFRSYSRRSNPGSFWIVLSLHVLLASAALYFAFLGLR